MGAISKEAVQKATLLALIGQFDEEGVYTKLRLHKLAYFAEDEVSKRPFTYKHYDHGPFSFEVQDELEELIELGMVKSRKLEEAKGGHKYFASQNAYSTAIDIVENTLPGLLQKIMEVVEDYGYLDQKTLLQKAYEKMGVVDYDEIIVEENLPEKIETEMSEEDVWDFELASNSFLINELSQLSQTINSIPVDEAIKAELFNA